MAKPLFLTLCLTILFGSCSLKKDRSDDETSNFEAWQVPIEIRVSRSAFSREPLLREIRLEGLSGEWLSAQVAIRSSRDIKKLSGSFTDLAGPEGSIIPADSGIVRTVRSATFPQRTGSLPVGIFHCCSLRKRIPSISAGGGARSASAAVA